MLRVILSLLLALISSHITLQAQKFWSDHANTRSIAPFEPSRLTAPYRIVEFQLDNLRNEIRRQTKTGRSIQISVPLPETERTFTLWNYPILPPALQARYPEIMVYKGISGHGEVIYLHLSDLGVFASIKTTGQTILIESPDPKTALVLYESGFRPEGTEERFACHVGDQGPETPSTGSVLRHVDDDLRIYRMAISTTGEFFRQKGNTPEAVMTEVVNIMMRVNSIFERDVGIRFILADDTDQLFFPDPATDPFTNGNPGALRRENTPVTVETLGFNNFDVGHVLGTNAGGIAFRGGACTAEKAGGTSSTFGAYSGTFFYHIVAHEIGHQFNGTHTFNLCDGFNEFPPTGHEPGSGSTILSYAGASNCGSNYVQSISDPYFHGISIEQILDYSRGGVGGSCAQVVEVDNQSPSVVIQHPPGLSIPVSTPFRLTASASDPDEDTLTYCWEEFDLGPMSVLGTPSGTAPAFRSLAPTTNPSRIFPSLNGLLIGLESPDEVLVDYGRPFTFRVTVRDNNPAGGLVAWDEISFSTTADAGPFEVVFPNGREMLEADNIAEILWDPAGTEQAPVNCQNVRILLSLDGGRTYPVILADTTANDGREFVQIPDTITARARVKIESVGNIFFAISGFNFDIVDTQNPTVSVLLNPAELTACFPGVLQTELLISSGGFDGPIHLDVLPGLPEGANVSFSQNPQVGSGVVVLTIDLPTSTPEDTLEAVVQISTAEDTLERVLTIQAVPFNQTQVELKSPASGQIVGIDQPTLTWTADSLALSYDLQIGSSPTFDDSLSFDISGLLEPIFIPPVPLQPNTLFYWRVRSNGVCGPTPYSEIRTFVANVKRCLSLEASDVPRPIPTSGNLTIRSTIAVDEDLQIDDVNVPLVMGMRQFVGDLDVLLIGPDTSVVLFANKCSNQSNFSLGFDDDTDLEITCPLTDNMLHKPQEPLSAFQGRQSLGNWQLEITDRSGGVGGSLDYWSLQICTQSPVMPPEITVLDTLRVDELQSVAITGEVLQAVDAIHPAGAITYSLVQAPSSGFLELSGQPLQTGDRFTQQQLNNGLIIYTHTVDSILADEIRFTISNPDGGFVDITTLPIRVSGMTISTGALSEELTFSVFPNPFRSHLSVKLEDDYTRTAVIDLVDVLGRSIRNVIAEMRGPVVLSTADLDPGIYFVHVLVGKTVGIRKVIRLR